MKVQSNVLLVQVFKHSFLLSPSFISGAKTRVSKDLVTKKSLKTLEKPSTAKVEKEEPKDGLDLYLANNQQTATSDLDGISPSISVPLIPK